MLQPEREMAFFVFLSLQTTLEVMEKKMNTDQISHRRNGATYATQPMAQQKLIYFSAAFVARNSNRKKFSLNFDMQVINGINATAARKKRRSQGN